ncbi:hypothetical protein MATL_G00250930 [Megalops atlanticus]|uniref:Uncharacterized protein n=1 Tax=Megalops atlanticus TaxID=7932 RepID=A0A9D3PBM5_MEGAT|nr:hypothetical protein MATL_G00250930 [Megalops atlanticus]
MKGGHWNHLRSLQTLGQQPSPGHDYCITKCKVSLSPKSVRGLLRSPRVSLRRIDERAVSHHLRRTLFPGEDRGAEVEEMGEDLPV